jgi:hypothetical protein
VKENIAKEKLRVMDIIKENASLVITIGGFCWIVIQFVILPIREMQFQMNDVLNNHLKTIQDEMIIATEERKQQSASLQNLSEQIVRLQTIIEKQ